MPSERKLIPIVCSQMSMIGVSGSPPHDWANYFSLHCEEDPRGIRISNFWWENLEAASTQFLNGGPVEVQVWNDRGRLFGLIDDARIPANWYHNDMCWTGGYLPSLEIATEMFAVRGDPNGELERWTDLVSYYKKRGGTYHENNGQGFVTYNTGEQS